MDYLIFSDVSRRCVGAVAGRDSDSERFQTADSSADEVDDCLSVAWKVEGLAVAEATGPKTSERPAGA